jgi:hypothetical protein
MLEAGGGWEGAVVAGEEEDNVGEDIVHVCGS